MVKSIVRRIPLVGSVGLFAEFLFLDRKIGNDAATISTTIDSYITSQNDCCLVVFPEGTFATERSASLVQLSVKFVKERHLEPLNYLLAPRTKGFQVAVKALRSHPLSSHIKVVDATLAFTNKKASATTSLSTSALPLSDLASRYTPTLSDVLRENCKTEAHVHLRVFSLDEIPRDDAAGREWLMARFVEKDKLLQQFHKTGSFGPSITVPQLPSAQDVSLWWLMLLGTVCMSLFMLPSIVCQVITAAVVTTIALALVLQFVFRDM